MQAEAELPLRILDEYVAGWNASDADRIASLFTEDARYGEFGQGRVISGRSQIADHLKSLISAVCDLRFTVSARPTCTQDRAFFKWTMRGNVCGGLAARLVAEQPFELQGATVLVIEGDKISRAVDSFQAQNANGSSRGLRSLSDGLPFAHWTDAMSDASEDNISYGE